MTMPFWLPSVLVVVGIVVTVVAVYGWRIRRAVVAVDLHTAAEVTGTESVGVEGTVEPARGANGGMQAPLSGEDCVAATWSQDMTYRPNDPQGKHVEEEAGADAAPFVVQDGSGELVVDPTPADDDGRVGDTDVILDLGSESEVRGRSNVKPRADLGSERREYTSEEARIEVGDEVYVQGTAVPEDHERATAGSRPGTPDGPVLVNADGAQMIVSASSRADLLSNPFGHLHVVVAGLALIAAGASLAF